jgi:PDZ domain
MFPPNDVWNMDVSGATADAGCTTKLMTFVGSTLMHPDYDDCAEPMRGGSYSALVDFLLEVLVEDFSPATPEERNYLLAAHRAILEDRDHAEEIRSLEEKGDAAGLTDDESAELERLRSIWTYDDWQTLLDRTERFVLNFCIANPSLFDLNGSPTRGGGSITPLLQRDAGRVDSHARHNRKPGWLGLQLTWSSAGLRVDGVESGSPAHGLLKSGDLIERIDGTSTSTLDGQAWASKMLAGPKGSPVWLRVKRGADRVSELITIVRAERPTT